jgi:hypothetical protein
VNVQKSVTLGRGKSPDAIQALQDKLASRFAGTPVALSGDCH